MIENLLFTCIHPTHPCPQSCVYDGVFSYRYVSHHIGDTLLHKHGSPFTANSYTSTHSGLSEMFCANELVGNGAMQDVLYVPPTISSLSGRGVEELTLPLLEARHSPSIYSTPQTVWSLWLTLCTVGEDATPSVNTASSITGHDCTCSLWCKYEASQQSLKQF